MDIYRTRTQKIHRSVSLSPFPNVSMSGSITDLPVEIIYLILDWIIARANTEPAVSTLLALRRSCRSLRSAVDHGPLVVRQLLTETKCSLEMVTYQGAFDVSNQTYEVCLAAVRKSGWALQHIIQQTPEICLAAVQQDGSSLKVVEEQSLEVCLAAIKNDLSALEIVRHQTLELCLAAVRRDWRALQYVESQTPEMCKIAIEQNGLALEFVKNQTPGLCLAATQQNPKAQMYVGKRWITRKHRALLRTLSPREHQYMPKEGRIRSNLMGKRTAYSYGNS